MIHFKYHKILLFTTPDLFKRVSSLCDSYPVLVFFEVALDLTIRKRSLTPIKYLSNRLLLPCLHKHEEHWENSRQLCNRRPRLGVA